MTVYCVIERDALGLQRVLRVYADARDALAALYKANADTDGRHWYHVDKAELEDAA